MYIVAHLEKIGNSITLGFGDFLSLRNGIEADDGQHYCYHYLDDAKLSQLFSKQEMARIRQMKDREQLVVRVEVSLMPTLEFQHLCGQEKILNARKAY